MTHIHTKFLAQLFIFLKVQETRFIFSGARVRMSDTGVLHEVNA